jgi:putative ABC transport system permease protein
MKFLPLIWAGLQRKKLRTILTLLSIFIAFLLYGFLGAIQEAFLGGVSMAGADRLVLRHKVSLIQTLPESYKARISSMPEVALVSHQTWFGGIYQDPKNFFPTIPVEPSDFLAMYPEFILSDSQRKAWETTRTGAIIGRTTADRFNWKLGDHVPIKSPIWGEPKDATQWDFEIVGIYEGAKKNTDTSSLYFR